MESLKLVVDAEHQTFSSIDHFRVFLKELRRFYRNVPEDEIPNVFSLEGTVKLHGTHADVVFKRNDDATWSMWCQSRNRVLSVKQDNCGFARFVDDIPPDDMLELLTQICSIYKGDAHQVMISGEFCGGSIQKNVALTALPTMFVMFDIKVNGVRQDFVPYRHVESPQHRIYNISRGGFFSASLCLDDTEAVVAILQKYTENVEKECPFAKSFGITGIGEGIVWKCRVQGKNGILQDSRFWFKVKGDEHTVSRVKTLKTRQDNDKNIKNTNDFVSKAVLPAKLEQGFDYLREMNLAPDMKNLGTYLKWVIQDVVKEDGDTIAEIGLDESLVKKSIAQKAKLYYKRAIGML